MRELVPYEVTLDLTVRMLLCFSVGFQSPWDENGFLLGHLRLMN